ncbi:MAG: hypothetical protein JOY70_03485 [Acidisphaera sp.]|nr:hypothetical protein [Acidisphaera sp.]
MTAPFVARDDSTNCVALLLSWDRLELVHAADVQALESRDKAADTGRLVSLISHPTEINDRIVLAVGMPAIARRRRT